jgi:hypothetical protein
MLPGESTPKSSSDRTYLQAFRKEGIPRTDVVRSTSPILVYLLRAIAKMDRFEQNRKLSSIDVLQ